jgi:hypothetical protein
VRSVDNRDRVVVLTSPMTWAAQNTPGATASGPDLSFNRPYAAGYGSAGFLPNDSGIVQLAERTGQRIGFVTDYDVASEPNLIAGAAAVVVGGDSQYWTASLRAAVRAAGDAGTNLAFFGAGTGARSVRLADDGRALQIVRAKPATSVRLTGQRPSCAIPGAGSVATSKADAGWVISDADWWGYRATKVATDDVLPDLVAGRVDRASTSSAGSPAGLQVLSFAQVTCRTSGATVAQSGSYFVRPSGAGVFTTGTVRWACAATELCVTRSGRAVTFDAATRRFVSRVTRNVIKTFAESRAGRAHPAKKTVSQYAALR